MDSWKFLNRETKRLLDYDLANAFFYNEVEYKGYNFNSTDVLKVFYKEKEKVRDESCEWVVALTQDRGYAFIKGWCDYTGWDCHSSLEISLISNDIIEVLSLVTDKIDLESQLERGRVISSRDKCEL